ncbi:MAG: hypothetical protein PVF36_12600, partial [Desulfobacterales bacterium]
TEDSIWVPSATTAAAVSSQDVSMPSMIIGALFFQVLSRDRFCSPLSFYRPRFLFERFLSSSSA